MRNFGETLDSLVSSCAANYQGALKAAVRQLKQLRVHLEKFGLDLEVLYSVSKQ